MPREIALIRRLIRENEIDVVLIGGLYTIQTAIAGRLEGVPVVWQILDTLVPDLVRRAIMPLVTRLADAVMTTGMEVARLHPGAVGMGNRLVPYYPPVDTNAFRPDLEKRGAARNVLGVPKNALLVGAVGNLNRTKGHQYLIEAARQILNVQPDTHFRVLGAFTPTHAAYDAGLRSSVNNLRLDKGDCFEFMDPGGRVRDLLPAFDVFASTSIPRSEGIPTTILEAMSTGIPIVATKVGGVSEVVEDGVSGFIVPPLEIDSIAGSIVKLLQNPNLRRLMGNYARREAVERFGIDACVYSHLSAFEEAMAHRNGVNRRNGRIGGSE